MRFDQVLDDVGGFSKFQFLTLCILCLPRFILPLHFLLHNFISATPPHRCALGRPEGGEVQDLRVPLQDNSSFSSCSVYEEPLTSDPEGRNRTVPCPQGWIYDQSQFSSTTATEVCLTCQS